MSKEEMKAAAVEKIGAIEDETVLENLLKYLSGLDAGEKSPDLSSHYNTIKGFYADVLKHLAE